MLAEEDIGVLETLQEDLKAARLRGKRLLLLVELAAVPEGIVERFGREPNDVCVWDEMCS
jgi:hypothetical protein